ncbi:hypothetical protein SAMN05192562_101440 [Kosakonia arachidis]|uniref:Uncharacterized protein n=1 Tax=Kosakonia arachidis TaxID=551989 RepID=A0A1I6YC01_9ENTR|nr:hypothetical protein SAMN05192562_101440 [Kosakonia arachidis]
MFELNLWIKKQSVYYGQSGSMIKLFPEGSLFRNLNYDRHAKLNRFSKIITINQRAMTMLC